MFVPSAVLFSCHSFSFLIISFSLPGERLDPLDRTGRDQHIWHQTHGKILLIVVFFFLSPRKMRLLLFCFFLFFFRLLVLFSFLNISLLYQEVGPVDSTGHGVYQQTGLVRTYVDGTGRTVRSL